MQIEKVHSECVPYPEIDNHLHTSYMQVCTARVHPDDHCDSRRASRLDFGSCKAFFPLRSVSRFDPLWERFTETLEEKAQPCSLQGSSTPVHTQSYHRTLPPLEVLLYKYQRVRYQPLDETSLQLHHTRAYAIERYNPKVQRAKLVLMNVLVCLGCNIEVLSTIDHRQKVSGFVTIQWKGVDTLSND